MECREISSCTWAKDYGTLFYDAEKECQKYKAIVNYILNFY